MEFLTKNTTTSVEELEKLLQKWKDIKKPSQIAASFSNILELEEKHLKHFRHAPYVWKPLQGSLWGGMLLDDEINYVHLVLATEDVMKYLIKL